MKHYWWIVAATFFGVFSAANIFLHGTPLSIVRVLDVLCVAGSGWIIGVRWAWIKQDAFAAQLEERVARIEKGRT